jgi:hypothetical protein
MEKEMPNPIQTAVGGVAATTTKRSSILRRIISWVLVAMGAVLLLGFILLFHTTPPPVIHTHPAAARRLEEKLQQAQTAASAGAPGVLRTDETELNSVLDAYFRAAAGRTSENSGAVVRDMKLNLAGDRLRAYVLVNLRGKDITVVFEGKVHSVNGYLDFEPLSGKIGALPIPKDSLKRALKEMAATPDTRSMMRLPSNLRDLHVEDGKLVVVYR